MVELVSNNDIYWEDKRSSKKMILPSDAVCTACGVIFNAYYEDRCVICYDGPLGEIREKSIEKFKNGCQHKEFIVGNQSVDLRILLDFHLEDLRALCEIHGCSEGSRSKMVLNIMRKLYSDIDKRIDEILIRKMIVRNRKKFRFWKDIEQAIYRAKKPITKIELISADDVLEPIEIGNK